MCGFVGYLSPTSSSVEANELLPRMMDRVAHRGPDAAGRWSAGPIALGHQRLSIHDLSPLGAQPMHSPSDRYVVVFNGEIYNYEEIRSELAAEGQAFVGDSDTEVLLAAVDCWGLPKALRQFIGMFAFALWDKAHETLTLARDRMGEKPVYYGTHGQTLVFGSQLSALTEHPAFDKSVDRDAVGLFLRYGYIPTPYSIYRHTRKLLAGTYIEAQLSGGEPVVGAPVKYWDLEDVATARPPAASGSAPDEYVESLDQLLTDAVSLQAKSDVPLGAFLSGGIDSSVVAAKLQSVSDTPINTFTIGFDEKRYNEAEYAKAIAQHLGTNHTELYISDRDLLELIPDVPTIYDEPFSDSSQVPTVIVGQLARRKVTVSLSGDGGDELFCGYSRYFKAEERWTKVRRPLQSFAGVAGLVSSRLSPQFSASGLSLFGANIGRKLHRACDFVGSESFAAYYKNSVSSFSNASAIVVGAKERTSAYDRPQLGEHSNLEHMMFADTGQYLLDDILVKVDRAFMASSLEGRVPFLDHRVVEFAWRVPIDVHRHDGRGKYLLRRVLERYVPTSLTERPKMGFAVPLAQWLRGPLREWSEELLSEARLTRDGIFDVSFIRKIWAQHTSEKSDWSSVLWSVLMLNAWLETQ